MGLHEQELIAGSTEEPICSFGFAVVSSMLWVPFVRENLFLQAEGSQGIGRGVQKLGSRIWFEKCELKI